MLFFWNTFSLHGWSPVIWKVSEPSDKNAADVRKHELLLVFNVDLYSGLDGDSSSHVSFHLFAYIKFSSSGEYKGGANQRSPSGFFEKIFKII